MKKLSLSFLIFYIHLNFLLSQEFDFNKFIAGMANDIANISQGGAPLPSSSSGAPRPSPSIPPISSPIKYYPGSKGDKFGEKGYGSITEKDIEKLGTNFFTPEGKPTEVKPELPKTPTLTKPSSSSGLLGKIEKVLKWDSQLEEALKFETVIGIELPVIGLVPFQGKVNIAEQSFEFSGALAEEGPVNIGPLSLDQGKIKFGSEGFSLIGEGYFYDHKTRFGIKKASEDVVTFGLDLIDPFVFSIPGTSGIQLTSVELSLVKESYPDLVRYAELEEKAVAKAKEEELKKEEAKFREEKKKAEDKAAQERKKAEENIVIKSENVNVDDTEFTLLTKEAKPEPYTGNLTGKDVKEENIDFYLLSPEDKAKEAKSEEKSNEIKSIVTANESNKNLSVFNTPSAIDTKLKKDVDELKPLYEKFLTGERPVDDFLNKYKEILLVIPAKPSSSTPSAKTTLPISEKDLEELTRLVDMVSNGEKPPKEAVNKAISKISDLLSGNKETKKTSAPTTSSISVPTSKRYGIIIKSKTKIFGLDVDVSFKYSRGGDYISFVIPRLRASSFMPNLAGQTIDKVSLKDVTFELRNFLTKKPSDEYYKLLGVKPDVAFGEIQKSYDKLREKYDREIVAKSDESQNAAESLRLLDEAYTVIQTYYIKNSYLKQNTKTDQYKLQGIDSFGNIVSPTEKISGQDFVLLPKELNAFDDQFLLFEKIQSEDDFALKSKELGGTEDDFVLIEKELKEKPRPKRIIKIGEHREQGQTQQEKETTAKEGGKDLAALVKNGTPEEKAALLKLFTNSAILIKGDIDFSPLSLEGFQENITVLSMEGMIHNSGAITIQAFLKYPLDMILAKIKNASLKLELQSKYLNNPVNKGFKLGLQGELEFGLSKDKTFNLGISSNYTEGGDFDITIKLAKPLTYKAITLNSPSISFVHTARKEITLRETKFKPKRVKNTIKITGDVNIKGVELTGILTISEILPGEELPSEMVPSSGEESVMLGNSKNLYSIAFETTLKLPEQYRKPFENTSLPSMFRNLTIENVRFAAEQSPTYKEGKATSFMEYELEGTIQFLNTTMTAKVMTKHDEQGKAGKVLMGELPKGWKLSDTFPNLSAFDFFTITDAKFIISDIEYKDTKTGFNVLPGVGVLGQIKFSGELHEKLKKVIPVVPASIGAYIAVKISKPVEGKAPSTYLGQEEFSLIEDTAAAAASALTEKIVEDDFVLLPKDPKKVLAEYILVGKLGVAFNFENIPSIKSGDVGIKIVAGKAPTLDLFATLTLQPNPTDSPFDLGVKLRLAFASSEARFSTTMKGMYKNAFGIQDFNIGNVALEAGFNYLVGGLPTRLGFTGSMKINEFEATVAILLAAKFGIYAKFSEFDLINIINLANKLVGKKSAVLEKSSEEIEEQNAAKEELKKELEPLLLEEIKTNEIEKNAPVATPQILLNPTPSLTDQIPAQESAPDIDSLLASLESLTPEVVNEPPSTQIVELPVTPLDQLKPEANPIFAELFPDLLKPEVKADLTPQKPARAKTINGSNFPNIIFKESEILVAAQAFEIGDIKFPKGFILKGGIEVASKQGYVDVKFTDVDTWAKGYLPKISIGPKDNPILLITGKGPDNVYGTADDGPGLSMMLSTNPLDSHLRLSALIALPIIGVEILRTEVSIDRNGIFVDIGSRIFDVFDVRILIRSIIDPENKTPNFAAIFSSPLWLKIYFRQTVIDIFKKFLIDGLNNFEETAKEKISKAQDDVRKLDQKIEDLEKKIAKNNDQVKELQKTISDKQANAKAKIDDAQKSVAKAREELKKIDDASADARKKLTDAQAKVKSIQGQIDKENESYNKLSKLSKVVKSVPHYAKIAGLKIGLGTANGALEVAKKTVEISLIAAKKTAEGTMKATEGFLEKVIKEAAFDPSATKEGLQITGLAYANAGLETAILAEKAAKNTAIGVLEGAKGATIGLTETAKFLVKSILALQLKEIAFEADSREIKQLITPSLYIKVGVWDKEFDVKLQANLKELAKGGTKIVTEFSKKFANAVVKKYKQFMDLTKKGGQIPAVAK